MLSKIDTNAGYSTIIANSPLIVEKLKIVEQVAQTDTSVLIMGESGVGKGVFAKEIHLKSKRKGNYFLDINCADISREFSESNLFGSTSERFVHANGGTVFLNEIAELPLMFQTELLQLIQERCIKKASSEETVDVNVRILAATNRDIEKQVERGEFHSDLYYRLNLFPLHIPPLRQRPEDIPDLADYFLKICMRETGKNFDGFSKEAVESMLFYSWPGNIRELKICIERACITGKGKQIEADDLFLKAPSLYAMPKDGNQNLKHAESIFRAHFIKQVLAEHNWNQTETAKALCIQRTYLSRLIKELNISISKE